MMNTQKMLCEETWKMPRRLHNMLKMAMNEFQPHLAQTPYTEIKRWGRVRLLRYECSNRQTDTPLLMVPSIINKYYVLDLRPGQSFVEYLTEQGIQVYMLDWGCPGPQDRFTTLSDHILGWLHAAVRATCRDAGTQQTHLLGYCIGGTFAAIYAALRPQRVAGLISLTSPVNFHDEGLLSAWASNDSINIERLAAEWGLIPCDFLQSSFAMLSPLGSVTKLRSLTEQLWDDKFVEKFLALETWLNDNVDFPGLTYAEYIRTMYRENQLVKGELKLNGENVNLADINCPVLTVTASKDHIVPPQSATILNELVSSTDKTVLDFNTGHIGVTVGGAARKGLWKSTEEWLKNHEIEK
jgi:polyhydroxyalkanoate synthase